MAQEKFVVSTNPESLEEVMYLTGYNLVDPPASTFGNLENAVEFDTITEAENKASLIGSGTVGTTKPNH